MIVETLSEMDFYAALKEVYFGRRVRRLEWEDPTTHILIRDGFLSIYQGGKFSRLLVSDADIGASDWVIATDGPLN